VCLIGVQYKKVFQRSQEIFIDFFTVQRRGFSPKESVGHPACPPKRNVGGLCPPNLPAVFWRATMLDKKAKANIYFKKL